MTRATDRFFVTASLLLLTSCGPSVKEPLKVAPAPEEVKVSVLEQVPSELSIEHFSSMRLAGTGLTLSFVITQNDAYTQHAIEYWSNGLRISGILNIPKGEGPFPLVIFNHGYIEPRIYTRGRGLRREQDYVARHGFAVLHTDYRGHGESDESPDTREVYDAGLEYAMDSINAIHAVREAALPTIDAARVGMLGHSLGGGVSLNIAVGHPELLSALVLYAPVHADAWENFVRWRMERPEGDRTIAMLGTRETNPEAWDKISSQTYLDRISTPILLFQGTEDDDVPVSWSDTLKENLRSHRKDVTYVKYDGERHEFGPEWTDFMEKTVEFLQSRLNLNPRE